MQNDEIHPGDVIAGKYRVRAILGRKHGLLVEAFHTEFDQRVVIKILLAGHGDERELERFRREARILAKLESEHVARIIDVGTEPDGSFYLVRQHLDGIDLGTYVKQNGPLALPDAVLTVLMVAEAVAETHSHGIIIREIQPGNLFLTQRAGGAPVVKITDFGTAKLMRETAAPGGELTATAMFGLSPYSSPELLRKAKNVDVRTDVWSLGTVFYELLTGRPPFTGETAALMLQITKQDPTAPSALRPDLSPEVDQVISWAIAKDVDIRFKNIFAFAHALKPFAPPEGKLLIEQIRQISEAARLRKKGGSVPPPSFAGRSEPVDDTVTRVRAPEKSPSTAPPPSSRPPASRPRPRDVLPPTSVAPVAGKGAAVAATAAAPPKASSSAGRKISMGLLAVAAVVLPLIVLFVVLNRRPNQGLDPFSTTPAATAVVTAIPTATAPAPPPVTAAVATAAPVRATAPPVATPTAIQVSELPSVAAAAPTVSHVAKAGATLPKATPPQPPPPKPPPPPPPQPEPPPVSTPAAPPPSAANGTLLAVALGGTCAFSVNGASKGTSSKISVSLKPGTYTVICRPETGAATISKSVTVTSGETAMAAFKL